MLTRLPHRWHPLVALISVVLVGAGCIGLIWGVRWTCVDLLTRDPPQVDRPIYTEVIPLTDLTRHPSAPPPTQELLLDPPTLRDFRRFLGHAAAGVACNLVGCDPQTVAVHWLKAAIHARTPREAQWVIDALRTQVHRRGDPQGVAQRLCLASAPRNWDGWDAVSVILWESGVHCAWVEFGAK